MTVEYRVTHYFLVFAFALSETKPEISWEERIRFQLWDLENEQSCLRVSFEPTTGNKGFSCAKFIDVLRWKLVRTWHMLCVDCVSDIFLCRDYFLILLVYLCNRGIQVEHSLAKLCRTKTMPTSPTPSSPPDVLYYLFSILKSSISDGNILVCAAGWRNIGTRDWIRWNTDYVPSKHRRGRVGCGEQQRRCWRAYGALFVHGGQVHSHWPCWVS